MNLLNIYIFLAEIVFTSIGVDLTFDGPLVSENSAPNPFIQYELFIEFEHPETENSLTVPGYFAADGNSAETGAILGNKWRCHFRVPSYGTGTWKYTLLFKNGGIFDPILNGQNGTFFMGNTDLIGKLIYNGDRHLIFEGSKVRYYKNAVGSSENALSYADFDGVQNFTPTYLHTYIPHIQDCPTDAPLWRTNKGRGLLGVIQYFASQAMTEVYWTLYNEDGGDGGGVAPWTVPNEHLRFDVSKLDQWRRIFKFTNSRKIILHLFLMETENETVLSDVELRIYIKEMMARFGDLDILVNGGEELNDTSNSDLRQISDWVAEYSPYGTPFGLHTGYNDEDEFDGVLGHINIHYISYQGDGTTYDSSTAEIIQESEGVGHPWAVFGDEQGPAVDDSMNNVNLMISFWDRNINNGGSGCSWYFGYQGCCFGDLQMENYRLAEQLFQLTSQHRLAYIRSNHGNIESVILDISDPAGIYDINDDRQIDIADKILEIQLNQN
jgi:hypothetical protein